jgi:hypothetical protein
MARVPEAEGALNVSHGKIKYALVSLLVSHVLCACLSLMASQTGIISN